MTCSNAFNVSADMYLQFWCIGDGCAEEKQTIEMYLSIAANDVYAALASVGACDCTLADWAQGYLQKLVLVDTLAWYTCPCGNPRVVAERKQELLTWVGTQLMNISTGVIDVCAGATGKHWPSMGFASQAFDEFSSAQVIWHDILRNS